MMKPILSNRLSRVIQVIDEENVNISKVINPYNLHEKSPEQQILFILGIHNILEIGHYKHYEWYLTTDIIKAQDIEIFTEYPLDILIALAIDDDILKPIILFHSDGIIYPDYKYRGDNAKETQSRDISSSEENVQGSFEIP